MVTIVAWACVPVLDGNFPMVATFDCLLKSGPTTCIWAHGHLPCSLGFFAGQQLRWLVALHVLSPIMPNARLPSRKETLRCVQSIWPQTGGVTELWSCEESA